MINRIHTEVSSRLIMAVGVVVVIWILAYVINLLLDPLRDIPGPLGARFSRIWYLRAISKGDFEKTNIDLHRVYGMGLSSLWRLSRRLYLVLVYRTNCPDSSPAI